MHDSALKIYMINGKLPWGNGLVFEGRAGSTRLSPKNISKSYIAMAIHQWGEAVDNVKVGLGAQGDALKC